MRWEHIDVKVVLHVDRRRLEEAHHLRGEICRRKDCRRGSRMRLGEVRRRLSVGGISVSSQDAFVDIRCR
jgi:hypothetical protein